VPDLKRVGVLISGRQPLYGRNSSWARHFEETARSLDVEIDIVEADQNNLDTALAAVVSRGARGLVVTSDGVYVAYGKLIAESAIRHRLPGIFAFRQQVRDGGLLFYAARVADLSRRAAFFVDRILKGEKPADLPIEQPTAFELMINLRTANTLGLKISPTLLALANEVIE
jgi:putative ABC transport system substrate-binding protein